MPRPVPLTLALALTAALGLSSCGRKGHLELPAPYSQTDESGHKKVPPPPPPHQHLPLDYLLN